MDNPTNKYNTSDSLDQQEQLKLLKEMLFSEEIKAVEEIVERYQNSPLLAQEISKIISEAIAIRQNSDDSIKSVLTPTIENAFRKLMHDNPTEVVTLLFPLIGSAIRRSISESLRNMMSSFSKTLELSFSWQAIKWRFEALRTGKPYGDIVLLNTLIYKVERVYLIHSKSGILLSSAGSNGSDDMDDDLMSGMLIAIQDFVRSCITKGEDSFDSVQMGDLTLIVETGTYASMALLIKGTIPPNLRGKVYDTLDAIHLKLGEYLKNFNGDTKIFSSINYLLDDCIEEKFVEKHKQAPLYIRAIPFFLLFFLISYIVTSLYFNTSFNSLVSRIDSEPGIMVGRTSGGIISGWDMTLTRDPLSADPYRIASEAGFPTNRLRIKEVVVLSTDAKMILLRLASAIALPNSPEYKVSYYFKGGIVYLNGSAPIEWVISTKDKVLSIPGVESVNIDNINTADDKELANLISKINNSFIEFDIDLDSPVGYNLKLAQTVASYIEKVYYISRDIGLSVILNVYGHSDASGDSVLNYSLSERRARYIAMMLYEKGIPIIVNTYGFGSYYSDKLAEEGLSSRVVKFKVLLSRNERLVNTLNDI